jgi:HSP20 family molecular chaperone IbpA
MATLATRKLNRLPSLWGREPFTALREEMNDFRARLFGEVEEDWLGGAMVPALDVSESETAVDVRMDVPGVTANAKKKRKRRERPSIVSNVVMATFHAWSPCLVQ